MTHPDATAPMQRDMFSGDLRDNRTRSQKDADKKRNGVQQIEMFRPREVAQFGVRAYRVMDLHPGRLTLISEDPRTPDEIEVDLQRKAEALTVPMFLDQIHATPEPRKVIDEPLSEPETPEPQPVTQPSGELTVLPHQCPDPETPEAAYQQIVDIARDQAATQWIDPKYVLAFQNQLVVAALHARSVGLSQDKILKAVESGRSLVGHDSLNPAQDRSEPESGQQSPVTISVVVEESKPYSTPRGARARLRQEMAGVRTR